MQVLVMKEDRPPCDPKERADRTMTRLYRYKQLVHSITFTFASSFQSPFVLQPLNSSSSLYSILLYGKASLGSESSILFR